MSDKTLDQYEAARAAFNVFAADCRATIEEHFYPRVALADLPHRAPYAYLQLNVTAPRGEAGEVAAALALQAVEVGAYLTMNVHDREVLVQIAVTRALSAEEDVEHAARWQWANFCRVWVYIAAEHCKAWCQRQREAEENARRVQREQMFPGDVARA